MARLALLVPLLSFLVSPLLVPGVHSTTFTFVNKCDYTVWPSILSNAGEQPLSSTGFPLDSGASKSLAAPATWGGRFWGRTHCSQDSAGKFSCLTGDCGSGKVECSGNGATPPATLAEFTIDGAGGMDFFNVSLVDGYNLPLLVAPQGGSGQNCTTTGCVVDLNGACPSELKVKSSDGSEGVACKSACEAFQQPRYCCSGAYSTPQTCKPSSYSGLFKSACPRAYSYAYDDRNSTSTCAGADYVITFCPSAKTKNTYSQKFSSFSSTFSPDPAPPAVATASNPFDSSTTASNPFDSSTTADEGTEESSGISVSHVLAVFGGVGGFGAAVWLGWYWRGELEHAVGSNSLTQRMTVYFKGKEFTASIPSNSQTHYTSADPKRSADEKRSADPKRSGDKKRSADPKQSGDEKRKRSGDEKRSGDKNSSQS